MSLHRGNFLPGSETLDSSLHNQCQGQLRLPWLQDHCQQLSPVKKISIYRLQFTNLIDVSAYWDKEYQVIFYYTKKSE